MNVFLIPLGAGRFEPYFEQDDPDEIPPVAPDHQGVVGRMRTRFAQMIRDAEEARHRQNREVPTGTVGRLKQRALAWVAERVAEQRLLWRLRGAEAAVLHIPDDQEESAAVGLFRAGLQKDGDRHRWLLALHSIGLLVSAPFAFLPGPNLFGYFFTFTVVGHFLSYRGARRGLSDVRWTVHRNATLTGIGRALSAAPAERYRLIHEAAKRLRLPHLARFVERMASPAA